jgi:membrane protease YdiL (CAAX protease family)
VSGGGPPLTPLDVGDRTTPGEQPRRVLREVVLLWLVTLLSIRAVVEIQALGLHEAVLAAVPFLFIYVPVGLCRLRGVDSYGYRLALPARGDRASWWRALRESGRIIAIILIPWLVGYHLYQTTLFHLSPARCLPDDLAAWFPTDRHPLRTCIPKDAWLLVPYHLFFVAIPEEFFYRGYLQTRLNEVLPRRFLIFGAPVGWGLPLACLFFAFGHSLVMFRWWHFATFFPGLLFGWLRERTGQPVAGALLHAWANVTVTWLDTLYGVA